jgi:hypothetical protein
VQTLIRGARFAWDLTVVFALGFRDDWREIRREARSDLRSVTRGTPD